MSTSQRRSNRASIVSSMGLAPRQDIAEPTSPPVWTAPGAKLASDTPRRSRSRLDSNASKRTDRYDSDAPSKGKKSREASNGNASPEKIRTAGSASAVPRPGSIRSTPRQPPAALPPTAEEDDTPSGGPFGLNRTFSRLFGGGTAAAGKGQAAEPTTTPTKASRTSLAEPPSSYDQDPQKTPGEGKFFGLVGKKAPPATPAADGDSRRTRYSVRAKPVNASSLSDNMTDLVLGDDLDEDDENAPRRPLGLGRMSSREARTPRSRHQSLLPERVPEEDEISHPAAAVIARNRASLTGNSLSSPSKKRVSRNASSRSARPRTADKAPQLPALAVGGSNFSGLVDETASLEPDYAEEEEASRPATAFGHVTEDEGDDVFEDVDPLAFPVTPNLADQARNDPFEAEEADVRDDDEALPILTGDHVATIGAMPLSTNAASSEEEDEEIPSYDETIAKEPAVEKANGDTKAGRSNGRTVPAVAAGGAGLGAVAGAFASKSRAEDASVVSDEAADETVPGAFAARNPSTVAPVAVDEEGVPLEDVADEPPATGYDSEELTAEEKRRHRELAAAGLVGAGGAGAAGAAAASAAKKSKKSKKVPRKEIQQDRRDEDGEEAGLVAAPALTRQVSPPPPDKPQKSKARKQQKAAAAAPASRDVADDKDRKKKKKKALAAGGLGAGGAAAAAAAAREREREPDSYDEEPAILTDEGLSGSDDDEMYDEIKYASKSSKKPSNGASKKKRSAAAPSRPSKRPNPVKNLTPIQRHYLLKALVSIQMQAEWEELEKLGGLTLYGHPFTAERPKLTRVKTEFKNEYTSGDDIEDEADDPYANDNDVARKMENLHEPLILRHLFHTHLMTFPGLGEAPLAFWQKRIQVFFDEMAARNFSTSIERGEYSKRRFYSLAATRYLGGYFARGVGVRGQGELRGPGPGEKGSERWGAGKQWGKGTVKRGLDRPARIDQKLWNRIDNLFGDGAEGDVWRRAGRESQRTRGDWQAWKEQIIENETGLEETINFLDISTIRNLPPKYRNTEEWARNHAAYLLHSLFVTSPNSDSVFSVLKGIHSLFPYWGAKQLLKYANAQVLIEGILNLLLARPAGAKSLIQRIATYVIGSEASSIAKEYLGPLRKDIDDAELVSRIDEYIKRGNRPEGRALRARAEKTGDDILTVILLTAEGKTLSRSVQDKVIQYQHAFARSPYRGCLDYAYPSSTPFAKENPDKMQVPRWDGSRTEEEEARKFAQLKLYLRESLKKRDREEAVKMASGALIPTVVKDLLQTVMYDVIKQIANTADLSGRLGDLQAFIDDLIDVKKKKDNSLQAWIALAARHENSLYYFVHECASISGPLFEWCQIGLDYMALSTTDPVHPADRSAKNIEVNLEELLQDSRLSDKDVELILEEVDELAVYTKWSKVAYELELRKNFLLARPDAATNSKLTEEDIPSAAMKEEVQDIDALMRELMEAEGVPVDDGSLPNESRGSEARELSGLWFDVMDPLGQHLRAEADAPELRYEPMSVSPPVPCLKYIRKAVPAFNDVLRERLPVYHEPPAAARSGKKSKGTSSSSKPAGVKRNASSKDVSKNKFSIF